MMKIYPGMPFIQGELTKPSREISSSAPTHSFVDELKTKIQEVDRLQHESNEAMESGAVNGAQNIHETMIKMEEAGLSRQLFMKVRGKALEAYQEVMRMQF